MFAALATWMGKAVSAPADRQHPGAAARAVYDFHVLGALRHLYRARLPYPNSDGVQVFRSGRSIHWAEVMQLVVGLTSSLGPCALQIQVE
jgi:hypothetical protein